MILNCVVWEGLTVKVTSQQKSKGIKEETIRIPALKVLKAKGKQRKISSELIAYLASTENRKEARETGAL